MTDFVVSGDYAVLAGAAAFTFPIAGDFVVESPLPSFTFALAGDFQTSPGTIVLIKVGDAIVETKMKLKLRGRLIAPDPVT